VTRAPGRPPRSLLKDTHPLVYVELHPILNTGVAIESLGSSSNKVVWWGRICRGRWHEWPSAVLTRSVRGAQCGVCSGKHVMVGENDLATAHPNLALQWHPTLNGSLTPQAVTAGSSKRAWWLCDRGHHFESKIASRAITGNGCRYCADQAIWPGETDMASTEPWMTERWHPTLNGDVTPNDVMAQSNRMAWWICELGHAYDNRCDRIFLGDTCPYCSGRRVLPGFNDIATTHPDLATRWHPTKNGDFTPTDVSAGSDKRVWWVCDIGHAYDIAISTAASGVGCGTCSGHRVLPGFNDLASLDPEVAAEWHPTKNGDLLTTQVALFSQKDAWWLGEHCGHAWKVRINARTGRDRNGCPKCQTSYVERALAEAFGEAMPGADVVHDLSVPVEWRKGSRSARIDIGLNVPTLELPVLVEHDGQFWHRNKADKDIAKTRALLDAGYTVVRIREGDLEPLDLTHHRLLQVHRPLRQPLNQIVASVLDLLSTIDA
jgi:hypothetical protein